MALAVMENKEKVVIFCGGRGSGELANQLLDLGYDVTCCVNAYDDGLSTGRLRHMFDILGPSDIRKNLLSLMDLDARGYWSRYEVFAYRYPPDDQKAAEFRREIEALCSPNPKTASAVTSEFSRMLERTPTEFRRAVIGYLSTFLAELRKREAETGMPFSFSDSAIGNCILVGALYESNHDWSKAISGLEQLLETRGHVELVSDENLHLSAICTDGRILESEAAVISDSNGDIVELFFTPRPAGEYDFPSMVERLGIDAAIEKIRAEHTVVPTVTESAKKRIVEADELIYGSGTFFSSILPTLQIPEVQQAIAANPRPKTMILNIVEEADTRGLKGIDLVEYIAANVGVDAIQKVVVNEPRSAGDGYFVLTRSELDSAGIGAAISTGDFESRTRPGRHDPLLLVSVMKEAGVGLEKTPAATSAQPLVSVLMLAWNRKEEVEIGLREMRKLNYPKVEVIVVDNGSVDGTAQMIYEKFPEVNVVRLHKNTGMTGYNVGLATAKGKYVIMLDDDSHLATDAVSNMVKLWESEENRDVGVMAFRVINPINGSLVTHLWEERVVPAEPGREREITSFAACGAAVRRDMLDEVGYFDDDFFLYATEDDLSIRVWNAGYKIVYEPRCVSNHRESGIMRSWKRYGFGFRNATWFNLKHLPLDMLPLVFVRNLFWLVTRSIRFKSLQYFTYGFIGLFKGYLQLGTPLGKRKVVKRSVAKFCLNDNWITRPIFSTSWRIYKDKRYILDKRGVSPGGQSSN